MIVTIEKIVYPGRRLGFAEGTAIFTDEGLPGERVEVEPVRKKKNHVEGVTTKVLTESPERVRPRCAHYLVCSTYQSMAYEAQIAVKTEQLGDILAGLWDFEKKGLDFVASPRQWHYRNRVRLRLIWNGGRAQWAYHRPGSERDFIAVGQCYLISEPITRMLDALLGIINEKNLRTLLEVEARESRSSSGLLLSLYRTNDPGVNPVDPVITGLDPHFSLTGIVSVQKSKNGFTERLEWGRNHIEEKIGSSVYMVGARSFFQVNVEMLERVIEDMKALAFRDRGGRLADLYCGLGTFGIALAQEAGEVFGVESEPDNIFFLKKNIERNRLTRFQICEGKSEDWAPAILAKKMDAVVCDPPRKGLGPEIVQSLLQHRPPKIIYLSCNPATLARDIKALRPEYEIEALRAYDFFPHTPHIETLAILSIR
jgi:23S rRNA (uracil1939-C5)-methyltransferase